MIKYYVTNPFTDVINKVKLIIYKSPHKSIPKIVTSVDLNRTDLECINLPSGIILFNYIIDDKEIICKNKPQYCHPNGNMYNYIIINDTIDNLYAKIAINYHDIDVLYNEAISVKLSKENTYAYALMALHYGHIPAIFTICDVLFKSRGLFLSDEKLYATFEKYCQLGISNGIAKCMWLFARLMHNLKKTKLAHQYLHMAIEKGCHEAMETLSNLYIGKSKENEIKYRKMAAKNGSITSAIRLINYFKKCGNHEKKIKYMIIAAENGCTKNAELLAKYYEDDDEKMIHFAKIGADEGNPKLMHMLGVYYLNKYKCENTKNYKKLMKHYFTMAINKGHNKSRIELVKYYKDKVFYYNNLYKHS